jgi:hypothetical protein
MGSVGRKCEMCRCDPFSSRSLGIVTLPYVIAEIEKGDAKLIPAVHQLTKGKTLKKDATQSEVLEWWRKDKEKWLISDPNRSSLGDR